MNKEIKIEDLFFDDTNTIGDPKARNDDFYHELFGVSMYSRPSILTPIVCGSSSMNVRPISDSVVGEYLRTGLDYYAKYVGLENAAARRRQEWALISQKRPIYVSGRLNERFHSYPKELLEYNDFIFLPRNIAVPKSHIERRDYLREKDVQKYAAEHQRLLHLGHTHGHFPPGYIRKQFFFDPNLVYSFEFHADYFDFGDFTLRPKIMNTTGVPRGIGNFISGRFSFSTAEHIVIRETATETVSRVLMVCKSRQSAASGVPSIYFWCIAFELTLPKLFMY
jgi:hypothetical protein